MMGELLFVFVPGGLLLFVFCGAIAAFVAIARINRLTLQIVRLERARLTDAGALAPPPAVPQPPPPSAGPEVAPPELERREAVEDIAPAENAAPSEPETIESQEEAPIEAPEAPPTAAPEARWEEIFTGRWLVWLGSVTLALGGFFLVKYSIDRGWIGPVFRVLSGLVMGLALIGGGEWLRRRPLEQALAHISPSYIPPALVAAGVATIFASLYAAHGLYDLIGAALAFVLLALTAASAVLLALLHGWFVAVLGVLGAFAVPALVSTGRHSTEILFPYIFVLVAGILAVVRHTGWYWLNWLALLGAVGYTVLWFGNWRAGDDLIVGPFLILLGVIMVLARPPDRPPSAREPDLFEIRALSQGEQFAAVAAVVLALLVLALVGVDEGALASLIAATAAIALLLIEARRESRLDGLALLAVLLALAVALFWQMPGTVSRLAPIWELDGEAIGKVAGPLLPPELKTYFTLAIGYGGLLGLGGFAALWGARRPGYWAALSGIPPVLLLAVAYLRIERFELDLSWALAAVILAGLLVLAAERVARFRDHALMRAALGAYAVGAVGALAVAFAISMENAWLTVALSLQVAAIVWIDERLEVPALRRAAEVVAYIVLARLVLNPQVLDYSLGSTPGLNWLLYGYGLPALAFWWASRRPGARRDPRLADVLEAAALLFLVLLVTLEIRHLIAGGRLDAFGYMLAEQSLNTIAWLTIAYVLYHRLTADSRLVHRYGWRILASLATAQAVLLQLGLSNPLLTGRPVGEWPIFDLLLLAYGGPAVFAILFLRKARARGDVWPARIAGAAALLFGFVWISLEVRHAFQGSNIGLFRPTSDAEWYADSVAWLALAGLLLALAILRDYAALRFASLGVVMFTVGKVFLFDMAALTGIFRALSFIGLGLCLVGVGFLYRRFVFPPRPPTLDSETRMEDG